MGNDFCLLILTTLQDEMMITNCREQSYRRRVDDRVNAVARLLVG